MFRIEAIPLAALLACALGAGSAKAALIAPSHDAAYRRTLNGEWAFKYLPGK